MELKDKRVLVTGASSGIGHAAAVEFAKKGAIVLINYRNNKTGAEKTLEEVSEYSTGKIYQADLEVHTEAEKMIDSAVNDFGNIDILINNAGAFELGEFDEFEIWESQFKNILMTAVYTSTEFIKKTSGKRKIINTSSIYGTFDKSNFGCPQYSAMKAAMSSFTTTLAKKYGGEGILVNAVAPGWTLTEA